MSLTTDLREEKGQAKKLKGDIQQLEEELSETKTEKEAIEKVPLPSLLPLPPPSHLNFSPPPPGPLRSEEKDIVHEETV